MAEGTKLMPAPLLQLGFGGVTPDVYINVAVFAQPCRWVMVQNLTDEELMFSWDGTTNNFVLPSCANVVVDCATNRGTPQTIAIPQGYGVWVTPTGTLPTTGNVNVSYFYAA